MAIRPVKFICVHCGSTFEVTFRRGGPREQIAACYQCLTEQIVKLPVKLRIAKPAPLDK